MNILKTNLAMNLSATEHEVHAVGLGKEDGVLTLRVPLDTWRCLCRGRQSAV